MTHDYPAVQIKAGREKPIQQRHPWVFSGAIAAIPNDAVDGEIVDVVDGHGKWLARGYLNRTSQIQVRILTWTHTEAIDADFWRGRLSAAVARRSHLLAHAHTNACRMVNGESDYLPGLIVDSYAGHLILQVGTLGIDKHKQQIAEFLAELCGAISVSERSDTAARRLEGLDESHAVLAGSIPPEQVEIHEGDLHFIVEFGHGQKTGFYLDQRANRSAVAAYCQGASVLNGFSYSGAFGVHALAAGATHVTNIDSSVDALELAEVNLRRNGFDPDVVTENIAGDIFQVLRDWRGDPDAPLLRRDHFGPAQIRTKQAAGGSRPARL